MEPDRFDDVVARYEFEPEPPRVPRRRRQRGALAFVAAWIVTSALAAGALALGGSEEAATAGKGVKRTADGVVIKSSDAECRADEVGRRHHKGSDSSSSPRY
jgi:anti-sigma factor RsiW